ncbi:ECF transporter S component [Gracilibacillus dipsosauri]|uniref:ECF transporter S component n=1 Tax=Gracilibacillus dipsosauri TaxID=178340 RepID=A0A317KZW5_9BACI|nr:ECF transporter S component [Gracilibacillus dipsosauri]PWU69102.1 ECF transporter S component [Gracilibacillus dipsosauri]
MRLSQLTTISLLAALAVVGRIFFQFLPNIQPVSSIIILSAFYLGPLAGVLLAITAAYVSNLALGVGIWTIWQIISWGIIGLIVGFIGMKCWNKPFMVVLTISLISGYVYGFILSLGTYTYSGTFFAYYIAGLPFDTLHAIGNVIFTILLYPFLAKNLPKQALS